MKQDNISDSPKTNSFARPSNFQSENRKSEVNKSVLYNITNHNNDLSFEEDRHLINKSMRKDANYETLVDMTPSSENPQSESQFSMRHLSESGKAMRTSDPRASLFNMLNMYIGIALIALPKAVSEVGFIAALIGLVLINGISLGASYFLLKARNRFKK